MSLKWWHGTRAGTKSRRNPAQARFNGKNYIKTSRKTLNIRPLGYNKLSFGSLLREE